MNSGLLPSNHNRHTSHPVYRRWLSGVDMSKSSMLHLYKQVRRLPLAQVIPTVLISLLAFYIFYTVVGTFFTLIATSFAPAPLYVSGVTTSVIKLSPDFIADYVGNNHLPTLTEFYAEWCHHCQALAPQYEQIAKHYSIDGAPQNVYVTAMDSQLHRTYAESVGIDSFPTIRLYAAGEQNTSRFETYKGKRNYDAIVSWLDAKLNTTHLPLSPLDWDSIDAVELNSDNFDAVALNPDNDVLVEFFAPWCGHCQHFAPTYRAVTHALLGQPNLTIAKIKADVYQDISKRYGIDGYPTIKWFARGAKEEPIIPDRKFHAWSVDAIADWVLNHTTITTPHPVIHGRIEVLDKEVQRFIAAPSAFARMTVYERTADLLEHELKHHPAFNTSLKYYGLYMKHAVNDMQWLHQEKQHLTHIVDNNLATADNIVHWQHRLHIIDLFVPDAQTPNADAEVVEPVLTISQKETVQQLAKPAPTLNQFEALALAKQQLAGSKPNG